MKTCRSSGQLVLRTIGHRYLRLDRTVEGFARPSPSILREFMTYTVVGAPAQAAAIEQAAEQLRSRTLAISRAKHRVAERFVAEVFDSVVPEGGDGNHRAPSSPATSSTRCHMMSAGVSPALGGAWTAPTST